MAADEKILSYNDVVLRRSDLDILSGPYFLNDRIIEFCFSHLVSQYPSEDILLVPPSISFWIMNCPDLESLKDFVGPLKLPDKKVVIFSVNNNEDVNQAEGGSHWSLVAYERKKNMFVHHDSLAGLNRLHAKRLFKAVVRFLGNSGSDLDVPFIDWNDTPQQLNGYDCGLYLVAIAEVICNWHINGTCKDDDLWFDDLKEKITPSKVAGKRTAILMLIKDLMAKK